MTCRNLINPSTLQGHDPLNYCRLARYIVRSSSECVLETVTIRHASLVSLVPFRCAELVGPACICHETSVEIIVTQDRPREEGVMNVARGEESVRTDCRQPLVRYESETHNSGIEIIWLNGVKRERNKLLRHES